jgi:hypothetical protein
MRVFKSGRMRGWHERAKKHAREISKFTKSFSWKKMMGRDGVEDICATVRIILIWN